MPSPSVSQFKAEYKVAKSSSEYKIDNKTSSHISNRSRSGLTTPGGLNLGFLDRIKG